MSEIAPLENDSELVEANPLTSESVTKLPRAKRSVKEFLRQYRALGLPNAKKMRRRTRLEAAEAIIALYKNALVRAVTCQGEANTILAKIADEKNWSIRHIEQPNYQADLIEWVADDDVVDEAQRFLKRFTPPTASISDQQQP